MKSDENHSQWLVWELATTRIESSKSLWTVQNQNGDENVEKEGGDLGLDADHNCSSYLSQLCLHLLLQVSYCLTMKIQRWAWQLNVTFMYLFPFYTYSCRTKSTGNFLACIPYWDCTFCFSRAELITTKLLSLVTPSPAAAFQNIKPRKIVDIRLPTMFYWFGHLSWLMPLNYLNSATYLIFVIFSPHTRSLAQFFSTQKRKKSGQNRFCEETA